MKQIINSIKIFFTAIDYKLLVDSLKEVFFLTIIAFLPLLMNILITGIDLGNFTKAFRIKILPGEILSYCLSFIAPSLYLILVKSQGTNYRLPFLHIFSLITLTIYVSAFALYIVAKNNYQDSIDLKPHNLDFYFRLTLYYLLTTIVFRIYSVYHGKNMTTYAQDRLRLQQNFNIDFTDAINNNQ